MIIFHLNYDLLNQWASVCVQSVLSLHSDTMPGKREMEATKMARETDREAVRAPVSSSIDMSLFRHSAAVCCSADDVISTCCARELKMPHTYTAEGEGVGGRGHMQGATNQSWSNTVTFLFLHKLQMWQPIGQQIFNEEKWTKTHKAIFFAFFFMLKYTLYYHFPILMLSCQHTLLSLIMAIKYKLVIGSIRTAR